MSEKNLPEQPKAPLAVDSPAPCSALRRYRLVMEAGCRRNWRPIVGSDSHYLNWLYWESMSKEHDIRADEADAAWLMFLNRHGETYPNGNWREKELEYERTVTVPNDRS